MTDGFTTHKKLVIGCNCSQCRAGLHRFRNKRAKRQSEHALSVRRIRRAFKQLGKLITRLSRGYTD